MAQADSKDKHIGCLCALTCAHTYLQCHFLKIRVAWLRTLGHLEAATIAPWVAALFWLAQRARVMHMHVHTHQRLAFKALEGAISLEKLQAIGTYDCALHADKCVLVCCAEGCQGWAACVASSWQAMQPGMQMCLHATAANSAASSAAHLCMCCIVARPLFRREKTSARFAWDPG